jgi:hypothetical protein
MNAFRVLGVDCCFLLGLQFLRLSEFLLEAIDSAFGVYQLLPAGEKRMAAGADFDAQIASVRGASVEMGATRANDIHFLVGRVDSGFHCIWGTFSV